MPEPLTGDVNAEEIWDSVCKEIITSGLNARKCDPDTRDRQRYRTFFMNHFSVRLSLIQIILYMLKQTMSSRKLQFLLLQPRSNYLKVRD